VVRQRSISAREALHVGVVRRHRIRTILTFDRGFERVPAVDRVSSS
jgi:predicted nucleic acid-binding protein